VQFVSEVAQWAHNQTLIGSTTNTRHIKLQK